MVTRSFKVKKRDFDRRPLFTFQHKLRTLMKCYTIRDLVLDEVNFTIAFKKTHKINGLKMQDPKEYICRYETLELENTKEIILKITI